MRIVAIGDSIVKGTGAGKGKGWVDLTVRALFSSRSKLRSLSRYANLAKGGANVEELAETQIKPCCELDPELVIIGIGVNDSRYRPSLGSSEIPLQTFTGTLNMCLETLRNQTKAQVILAGQVPVIEKLVDPYKRDKHYRRSLQESYEGALLGRCLAYKCFFLDNYARWLSMGERRIRRYLVDGLHPNAEGHAELARYATAFIRLHVIRK